VNRLLKQFAETSKMMKMVAQGKNLRHMMGNVKRGRH